jgi:glycolate oxidase iron-sulfur subunit
VRLHLDQCLGCRACETACPSGVQYGAILEQVRATLPVQGWRARLRRRLLRSVLARPRRLRAAFALARAAERLGLRWLAERLRLLPRGAAVLLPRIVALVTGCVMEGMFGDVNRKTLALLRHNGFTVDVPASQRCCGALLLHDGDQATARLLARQNLTAFPAGTPIIVNSAGCGAALKDYGALLDEPQGAQFSARVRDVTEWLGREGLAVPPAPHARRVAYDDPCHLSHAQRIRQEPRTLLAQVPGLELVAHPSSDECCGSAGIYNLVQPELAAEIGRKKARALIESGAEAVVTGNPGCMLQIAAHLRACGRELPVLHPVELLLPEEAR